VAPHPPHSNETEETNLRSSSATAAIRLRIYPLTYWQWTLFAMDLSFVSGKTKKKTLIGNRRGIIPLP